MTIDNGQLTISANERSAIIKIGGTEYELILTTLATKQIGKRYGGLGNLSEKLMKSDSFEQALDEVTFLITLLANQGILIHNLKNKDNPKPLLTDEEVELLTSPMELAEYKSAIMECMYRGTKREIFSEEETSKNAETG